MRRTFKTVSWAMLLVGSSTIALLSPVITAQSSVAEETEERKTVPLAGLCRNLQPQFMLTGHLSPVKAIAVSADSKTLVSGDENGVVNIWSLETGQLLRSLAAYPGTARAIAITPDGKSIVSLVNGDEKNSTVSVWSLQTGQLIRTLEAGRGEGEALAISPDGKSIVSIIQAERTGETDEKDKLGIKVWRLETGELIQSLTKEQGVVQTLDSLDTPSLIRISEVGEDYSSVVNIEFFNRKTGNIIQPASPMANQRQYAERDPSSAQDSSKKIAATVSVRGLDKDISFVTLQDSASQKSLCTVPKRGRVQNILLSPDDQKLIVAGQKIEVMALNPIPIKLDRAEHQAKIQHLNWLGLDKLKRKQYYSAAQHFWQVFELNRQLADEQGEIDALYNIAEAKYALCNVGFNSCRTDYQGLYKLLLPHFQAKGNRTHAAIALYRIGKGSSKEEAWTFLHEALKIYNQTGDIKGQQNTLIELGAVSDEKGDRQHSTPDSLFNQAINISKVRSGKVGQYQTLLKIGQSLDQRSSFGEKEQAHHFFKLALANVRATGDRKAEAWVLSQLGASYSSDESINFYRQALKIYRSLGDRKAEADMLVKMAWASGYKVDDVQVYLKQALALYREVRNYQGELEVLHGLGVSVLGGTRDRDNNIIKQKNAEAITYLKEAALLSKKAKNYFLESTILLDLGDAYRFGEQYSEALLTYQEAFKIRQTLDDDTGGTILLYRVATIQHRLKQHVLAVETYQKIISLCKTVEGKCLSVGREYYLDGFGDPYLEEIGEVYFDLKQYSQALSFFLQVAYPWPGWTHQKNLGLTYENLGNDDLALKHFDRVLNSRGPGCGDGATADATIVEAIRHETAEGDLDFGCAKSGESWRIDLSVATVHKAEIHRKRGQYSQAVEAYERSIGKTYSEDTRAILLNNLGTLYKSQGKYNEALKTYWRSLIIRQNTSDLYGKAVSLNNIGEIYRRQGKYSYSLETYQLSLKLFRAVASSSTAAQASIKSGLKFSITRQGEASVLHNFGSVYYDLGQYSKALEYYNQSLRISETLDDKAAQGRSLNNIGLTYEAQQQYTKALETYQQALIARREAEDLPGEAATLNNIGLVHTKMNQPSQGVEPLQQALSIFQKLEDKASEANTLDSLGTLYTALGQSELAWESYQNALRLVKEANLPPLEKVIFSNVGNLLVKTKQPELAIVFYKQSVNLTETIRDELRSLPREQQESYTQTVSGTYRNLAALLIQQGRLSEAHAVLELLKLRELSDFTRTAVNVPLGIDSPGISLATIEETALKQILKQFTTLGNFAQKLAKCETKKCPELKQIRDQRNALNLELDRELANIRVALTKHYATQPSSLSPEKLNAEASRIVNAQPGTVLIYPLVLKDKVQFLLALKAGNGAVTFRPFETQVSAEELFKTVQTFRKQLGETTTVGTPKTDLATVQDTSQQLYEWLIKPLEPELSAPGVKHLVFAPDLITRYIPLAALHDGKQYLIQRFTISTITAASKTDTEARVPRPKGTQSLLLAMGVSTFKNLNPLANVPAELDAITKTNTPKDRQGIYPGSEFLNSTFDYEALQASLEKGTYQILHLATHGAFVAGRPENSYLVPGRGQNLTTELIDQLRSYGLGKIHLVVLSACETAVGDRASDGMEIPGISYFFLKNEVKAVMASLWNVNDASTALIMQQFYTHIAAGMTKAQALQTVQQDLINGKFTAKDAPKRSGEADIRVTAAPGSRASRPANFAHPYYWAPFILIGNSL